MEGEPPEIRLSPIGYVRHPYNDDEVKRAMEGVCGEIRIYPRYRDGLRGIEGFSHVFVLAYLHKVTDKQREVLTVRFKRLTMFGFSLEELPEVGVFASDSPHRPNPISLSVVRVMGVRDDAIEVCGLDLFDGTPVIDIKPYTPGRAISPVEVPKWFRDIAEKLEERGGKHRYL